MKRFYAMTALVLLGAVLMTGTAFAAVELPAQDGRMWAPTGDEIGVDKLATVGFVSWDPHGNKPKYAEDWQQEDDILFNALFGYNNMYQSGRTLSLRGFGESGRGTFAGRFTFRTGGKKDRVSLEFRNFTSFSDITSEMRAQSFGAPPAPPALPGVPANDLRMARVGVGYDLGQGFALDLGYNRFCRKGSKASLLRGSFNTGDHVPNLKVWDTQQNEFVAGVGYTGNALDARLGGSFSSTDGDRLVGDHAYRDDTTLYRLGLDANYRLGKSNILGAVNTSKLETQNGETWESRAYSPNGESKTVTGRLGVITRFGRATTARITAGMASWNNDNVTALDGTANQSANRDRSRFDAGLLVTNTSLSKTRIRLDYRFRSTELDETVEQVVTGIQAIDQKRTSNRAGLRVDTRLSRKSSLRVSLNWRNQSIDETTSGDDLFYTMGDRKVNRFGGRLALQTRPMDTMRLDVGVQGHGQTFERTDIENAKTKNNALQGFLGLNIRASKVLTFFGTGSYGYEKYEIDNGPETATGFSPLYYNGKTLRFAPGAILQVTQKMDFEAQYEGVYFQDPADAPGDAQKLDSDLDRVLLRAGYRVAENMKVSATYRRNMFDENRWDDYIMDLYSLSVSGRF